jgi:phage shock protein A
VNEEMGALILNELTQMRRDSQVMLEKVVRIEETVRDVGDHEARIRVLEQAIPDEIKVRLNSLEKWRWTAVGAITAAGGSLAISVLDALKGVS